MKKFMMALSVGAALLAGAHAPSALADPATPTTTPAAPSKPKPTTPAKPKAAAPAAPKPTTPAAPKPTAPAAPAPAAGTASAGKFCAKTLEGTSSSDKNGANVVCAKGSDGRDRWTKK